jgi:hypothetical protein
MVVIVKKQYLRLVLSSVALTSCLVLLAGCGSAPVAKHKAAESQAPKVTLPKMSRAEKESWYKQDIDKRWDEYSADHPGVPRPTDKFIAFMSNNEYPKKLEECLAGFGVHTKYDAETDSVNIEAPTDQMGAMDLYEFRCNLMYPEDPISQIPMNDSQLELLYWYYTVKAPKCLKRFGLKAADPPSLASFKANYETDSSWSPFSELGSSDKEVQALHRCDQIPDGLYG